VPYTSIDVCSLIIDIATMIETYGLIDGLVTMLIIRLMVMHMIMSMVIKHIIIELQFT
jgi:hypothetical protein